MQKHLNIKIKGKVQGVYFRESTKNKARELNLTGFVRNEPDDSVYIEIEGEDENLDQFVDFCRSGPDHAEISDLDISEDEMQKYQEFKIKY